MRPMRGAVAGAAVLEGWAADLAVTGGIDIAPNHHHDTVGPMTGIITRSMPVIAQGSPHSRCRTTSVTC